MKPPADVVEGEPLARYISLKIGGPADHFAVASHHQQAASLMKWAENAGVPVRVLGGGSNLLVADEGVEGLVIKVASSQFEVVERDGMPVLVADAGATYASLARKMARLGYGGLEWASNVPGTLGGAVVNNAGAFGGETARCLLAAMLCSPDGQITRVEPGALRYAYRSSALKRGELRTLVTQVELKMERSTPEAAMALVTRYQGQRTQTQPRQLSAGSVFANPPGAFAGALIEDAGLKGLRIGGAQISRQHANFIVNVGTATATDVYALVQHAQHTVYERRGQWLHTEIELFGRWTEEARRALLTPPASAALERPERRSA